MALDIRETNVANLIGEIPKGDIAGQVAFVAGLFGVIGKA
jgi:hypothetical protein